MRTLWLVALLAGCGDDVPTDGGDPSEAGNVPDASLRAIQAPEEPALARPPHLLPCPDGWAEGHSAHGIAFCDPFPEGDRTCIGATFQLPGARACEPVGPACPEGDFPDDLGDGPIVFVRAGASDGDGSRARPFATIEEAVEAAPAESTIAIARGRYDAAIAIERSLTLRGACAAETVVTASGVATFEGVIRVSGTVEVTLRDMTIVGHDRRTVVSQHGALTRIEGAQIVGDVIDAVACTDAGVELERVVVRGARVTCIDARRCDLREVALYDALGNMFAGYESSVTMERVVLFGNRERRTLGGMALSGIGTFARLEQLALLRVDSGITTNDADIAVSVVYFDVGDPARVGAMAAFHLIDASGSVSRAFIRGGKSPRLVAQNEGGPVGRLTLSDIVVEDDRAPGEFDGGFFLLGADVEMERVFVAGTSSEGVAAEGCTHLGITDLTVRNTYGGPEGPGFGVYVGSSPFRLERVAIDGSDDVGLTVNAATGTLSDILVRDTGLDRTTGYGVLVNAGARVDVSRVRVERSRAIAIAALDRRTRIAGADVSIADALVESDDEFGRGLHASGHAELDLERVRIVNMRDHAVIAQTEGTITLREASFVEIGARGCATARCADLPYGVGVGAYGGTVALDGFELRRASLCGVLVASDSHVSLRDGRIAESAVGLCLGDDRVDLDAIAVGVTLEDNGVNLDSSTLPVPALVMPPMFGE